MMKNFSLYNLPDKVEYCKKCVVSNQRPSSVIEFENKDGKDKKGININKNGVCDACLYNDEKLKINWKEREEQLFKFLDKYRKNNTEFDCIVPSSGGKDSSFTAHILKTKYNMNPLAVTWAPNIWTNVGFENFNNLTRIGGVDSMLITPNGKLHRYLTKIAFLNLGHPFQPFIHGQKIIGPKIAKKFNISLIVYGENQAEYGNQIKENSSFSMNNNFFSVNDEIGIGDIKFGGQSVKNIVRSTDFVFEDFSIYSPLKKKEIKEAGLEMIYLGYFEKWDPQENFYYACENTGFKPASERSECTYSKYTEIDDKIVPFHFYMTFIKFGIGRATNDACQEIRNQKITRDEAINLVRKFDSEFPKRNLKEFLEYIDIDEKTFLSTVDEFRSSHLWAFSDGKWKLKHQI
tara:strand:- start:1807 stop:3018 length:1212 start_codon:yes stop_codon:yes gene_type:complete